MVQNWPTPSVGDTEGGSQWERVERAKTGFKLRKQGKTHKRKDPDNLVTIQGQLNPDWVEWLMGWPVFWSSLEPITELLWLDWSVDPADVESDLKQWMTPEAKNHSGYQISGGKRIDRLGTQAKKQPSHGIIPRVATGIKDRVNRLKAIGNGQVSQCAATAWEILKP